MKYIVVRKTRHYYFWCNPRDEPGTFVITVDYTLYVYLLYLM